MGLGLCAAPRLDCRWARVCSRGARVCVCACVRMCVARRACCSWGCAVSPSQPPRCARTSFPRARPDPSPLAAAERQAQRGAPGVARGGVCAAAAGAAGGPARGGWVTASGVSGVLGAVPCYLGVLSVCFEGAPARCGRACWVLPKRGPRGVPFRPHAAPSKPRPSTSTHARLPLPQTPNHKRPPSTDTVRVCEWRG